MKSRHISWKEMLEILTKPRAFVEISLTNPKHQTFDYLLEAGVVSALNKNKDHVPVKQWVYPMPWELRRIGTFDKNITFLPFKETPGFTAMSDGTFVGGDCDHTFNPPKFSSVFQWGLEKLRHNISLPDGYTITMRTGVRAEPIRVYDLPCTTTREEVLKLRGKKYIITETTLILGQTKYDYALSFFPVEPSVEQLGTVAWLDKKFLNIFISAKTNSKVATVPGWFVYRQGLWNCISSGKR